MYTFTVIIGSVVEGPSTLQQVGQSSVDLGRGSRDADTYYTVVVASSVRVLVVVLVVHWPVIVVVIVIVLVLALFAAVWRKDEQNEAPVDRPSRIEQA